MVFHHSFPTPEIKYGNCKGECSCGYHWKLGETLIKQVTVYKYLGVELDLQLTFKEFKRRIKEKARRSVSRVWAMGMYEALVRSVLEYGCVIWGDEDWEEGERVQREMGRRILRCNGKTTNEAVLGELGWWKLRTRREYCKLIYWIRILLMNENRLVKNVYHTSKREYETKLVR